MFFFHQPSELKQGRTIEATCVMPCSLALIADRMDRFSSVGLTLGPEVEFEPRNGK